MRPALVLIADAVVVEPLRVLGGKAVLVVPNHHVVEAVPAGLAEELVPDARGLLQEPADLDVLGVADAGVQGHDRSAEMMTLALQSAVVAGSQLGS